MSWFFFFNDTATTEIYTLSLHDALPIFRGLTPVSHDRLVRAAAITCVVAALALLVAVPVVWLADVALEDGVPGLDRKSTRLNSSHANISYAVFCLKKKKIARTHTRSRNM